MEGDKTIGTSVGEGQAKARLPLPKADKYIWAIYIAILAISVIELYSASSREVQATNVFGPLLRHGKMLLLGVGLTVGLSKLKYKWLIPLTPLFVTVTVVLAVYVLFKGDIINGARRSTTLLGIPIQPAELLKLAVVLLIALVMSRSQMRRGVTTAGIAVSASFVLLCSGLLFTQGLTNTLLLMGISFAMMLIGGVQLKKFAAVLLVYGLLGGGAALYKMSSAPEYSQAEQLHIAETGKNFKGEEASLQRKGTWKERIARWRNDTVPKYAQPINSENRQEQYSYMAQANGGIIGQLPGNSRETARLPLAFSDYIFAIVVEDWGFLGGMFLLALYLMLLTCGPGTPGDGDGSDDSAAGAFPYGDCDGGIPGVRPAAPTDFQRGLVDYSHLDSFRHNAECKPVCSPERQTQGCQCRNPGTAGRSCNR